MWHAVFITLHTLCGLVALVVGCVALRHRRWFAIYFLALVGLVAFLAVVVAVDWPTLDGAARAIFIAFLGLGAYMIGRGGQARRLLPDRTVAASLRYSGHVGFTLVGLADGFAVIAALDLGAPAWLATVIGVAGAGAGHLAIHRYEARLLRPAMPPLIT